MMKTLASVGPEVAKRKPGLDKAYEVFAEASKRTAQ